RKTAVSAEQARMAPCEGHLLLPPPRELEIAGIFGCWRSSTFWPLIAPLVGCDSPVPDVFVVRQRLDEHLKSRLLVPSVAGLEGTHLACFVGFEPLGSARLFSYHPVLLQTRLCPS